MCAPRKSKRSQKKAQQAHQKAAEREEGMGAHLFIGNPSTSLVLPTQQNAAGERQMDSPSPSTTDTITPSIDNLCIQLKSLTLNE